MRTFKTTKSGVPLIVEYYYDNAHEDVVIDSICVEDSDVDIYFLLDDKTINDIIEEATINFENDY